MTDNLKLPDLNKLVKEFVEEEIQAKARELLEKQVIAWAKAIGGPSAILDNIEMETEMKEASMDLPTATIKTEQKTIMVHLPKVVWTLKTIAKISIPEVRMERQRIGDHHHVKTVWKTKHLGFGIKTKIPELYHYTTPAYADVPVTTMRLEEIKTEIPSVEMAPQKIIVDLPTVTTGVNRVKTMMPYITGAKVDIGGVIKDFVPGASILDTIIQLIQEAEEFKNNLINKVEEAIDSALSSTLEVIDSTLTKANEAINNIQDKYEEILKDLEERAGEHSEEIKRISKELEQKVKPILEQVNKLEETISKYDEAKLKALSFFKSISININF
nr:hypothetical protein [uncultured Carboxylicivirga sp.]